MTAFICSRNTMMQSSAGVSLTSGGYIEIQQMSAGGAFGGNRGARPVPPEKGVFPLDHLHLCDLEKKDYINCLKTSGHKSERCRQFSKKYLECRMEKNLMAKQDMSELGFLKESDVETRQDESRSAKIEE